MPILRRARAKGADADDVRSDLPQGTLDLLILKVLAPEPLHGYGIAQRLRELSDDVLQVGESSLYPALQRLLLNDYVEAEWAASENNRRARYYALTPRGRKYLASERANEDVPFPRRKLVAGVDGDSGHAWRGHPEHERLLHPLPR